MSRVSFQSEERHTRAYLNDIVGVLTDAVHAAETMDRFLEALPVDWRREVGQYRPSLRPEFLDHARLSLERGKRVLKFLQELRRAENGLPSVSRVVEVPFDEPVRILLKPQNELSAYWRALGQCLFEIQEQPSKRGVESHSSDECSELRQSSPFEKPFKLRDRVLVKLPYVHHGAPPAESIPATPADTGGAPQDTGSGEGCSIPADEGRNG